MRRLGVLVLAVLLAACASPAPSGTPDQSAASPAASSPARPAPTPVPSFGADCEEGAFSAADCTAMRDAAMAAIVGSGHHAIHLWLDGGVLCPFVDNCLFNPLGNFPAPQPPEGADALPMGSAEVAFSDTDEHAGMNLYKVDGKVVVQFIGYRVPDRAWCSGVCPTATTKDGAMELQLVLPHLDWRVGEPIVDGQAILIGAPVTIYGAGSPIAFGYRQVDGQRSFGPMFDASCGPTTRDGDVFSVPLGKSGARDPNNPADDWIVPFLNADGVQLPAGIWDITAYAKFSDVASCTASPHEMQATLRVTVSP